MDARRRPGLDPKFWRAIGAIQAIAGGFFVAVSIAGWLAFGNPIFAIGIVSGGGMMVFGIYRPTRYRS